LKWKIPKIGLFVYLYQRFLTSGPWITEGLQPSAWWSANKA